MKYLGVASCRGGLNLEEAVKEVRKEYLIGLSQLWRISLFLPMRTWKVLYNALVLLNMDYCCVVWHECGVIQLKRIERLQNSGMRVITSSHL